MKRTNGSLKDFSAQNLLNKVKEAETSLHTIRTMGTDEYFIVIRAAKFICEINADTKWTFDIIKESADGTQTRIGKYVKLKESEFVPYLDAVVDTIVSMYDGKEVA